MDSHDKLLAEISDLLIRVMDNAVTAEEFAQLQQLLKSGPLAREYYFDLLSTLAGIEEMQDLLRKEDPHRAMDLLTALAENEKTATAVEIKKTGEKPAEKEAPKAAVTKGRPRVSKFSLVALTFSSAALLFLIAYAFFVSAGKTGMEVAVLSDSIEAKWSLPYSPDKGARLSTGTDPIQLTKGIIRIRTDNGAQCIVEAPAEIRFRNSDELSMTYGRIFVNVAEASNGFTVQTQTSKIIDLGTQFGVVTDIRGETELHVFEGKTVLIAGLRNNGERVMDVNAGQACRFSHSGEEVRSIQLSQDTFAKSIDSRVGLVWRGQKEINLADVVGGGNGFGTGRINTSIDPRNGSFGKPDCVTRRHPNSFTPVPSNVFIDGVFVPNGSTEQVITSGGLMFKDCPVTSGIFFTDLVNTPAAIRSMNNLDGLPIQLGDVNYSSQTNPSIFLHANLGITFDLNAFRTRLPGAKLLEFRSHIGISDSSLRPSAASFWVLIDGQLRYQKDVRTRGLADTVTIELKETDRFLTLVTTDGSVLNPDSDENAIGYDWCIFGNPALVLE